jgi:ketosteroid isomerase-like protein
MHRFLVVLALSAATAAPAAVQVVEKELTLRKAAVWQFSQAFNRQDAISLFPLLAKDAVLRTEASGSTTVLASDRHTVMDTLSERFRNCRTCRMTQSNVSVAGLTVTATEEIRWDTPHGHQSRRQDAVYEFRGSELWRITYRPIAARMPSTE